MKPRLLLLLLTALAAALRLAAAPADTTVSFVTVYPGHEIYELEGHSALHIRMPAADVAVSYGLFDFNAPNFVYRFVKGETDYCAGALPWHAMIESYRREGRRVVEHRLDLTADQKRKLIDMLEVNLRPENRVYRYNYVLDNCATRPLRMVELALGDTIMLARPAADSAEVATFRRAMRYYHRNYPWYQFGIDLALGRSLDRPIDNREHSFAPVMLVEQLRGATVGSRMLTSDSTVVVDLPAGACVRPPTPWWLTPLAVFSLLTAIVVAVCVADLRRGRICRLLHSLFYTLLGLAGCVLCFLVFVSVHEATSPNLLLLWINPLCFLAAIGVWLKKCKTMVLSYQIVNFALIMAGAVAFAILPERVNAAFVPLLISDAALSVTYITLSFKRMRSSAERRILPDLN